MLFWAHFGLKFIEIYQKNKSWKLLNEESWRNSVLIGNEINLFNQKVLKSWNLYKCVDIHTIIDGTYQGNANNSTHKKRKNQSMKIHDNLYGQIIII